MAVVKLRNDWYIGNVARYPKGVQEVDDEHIRKYKLPRTAEIISGGPASSALPESTPQAQKSVPKNSNPTADDELPLPKAYRGIPKIFEGPGGRDVIKKEEAIKSAFKEFEVESDGNTLSAWNALDEGERKSRIRGKANQILASL